MWPHPCYSSLMSENEATHAIDLEWFTELVEVAQARTGEHWFIVANEVMNHAIETGEPREIVEEVFIAWSGRHYL